MNLKHICKKCAKIVKKSCAGLLYTYSKGSLIEINHNLFFKWNKEAYMGRQKMDTYCLPPGPSVITMINFNPNIDK